MPQTITADFVCEHFLNYVFANRAGARHVRRVTAWIGMLTLAIEQKCDEWAFHRSRQFVFRKGDQWYKVRYSHKLRRGQRTVGGIQILKMDGAHDGEVIRQFTSLDDVRHFYGDEKIG